MNTNTRELASESIGRLMWKYFVPAFVGVIANSLYNIVDRIFIGQGVGASALSGVSVIFPIMIIIIGFGMMLGIGSSVLISIHLGKKEHKTAEEILGSAVSLIIISSVALSIIGLVFKDPILSIFGATEETFQYARQYLNIILIGIVFQELGFSLNGMIRSEGNAKVAMYSMLISAGTNVVLDALFIFVFDWGVQGAAWATVISMFVMTVWGIRHYRSRKSVIKLYKKNLKVEMKYTKLIVAAGMAPFLMQIASSFVQAIFNVKLIKFGGDVAVGAMGVIMSFAMLVFMSIVALNMASQPIIGYNYGAKAFDRVLETLKKGVLFASLMAVAGWLIIELFPETIIRMFSNDQTLLDIGVPGLQMFMLALPVIGFQIIASNYFQSIGKAKIAAILTLLRQVVVLIPVLLLLPGVIGLKGIWLSAPIADVGSAIITSIFLIKEWKKLNGKVESMEKVYSEV
ncbi:MATE family efflux transporter [Puteibacter caeruleilacunae]|nr:MATE family efflux transporter [Puteibacter caeruleilacunae]